MAEIQQLIKLSLKKIQLDDFRTKFGLHACLKLQGFEPVGTDTLQSMTSSLPKPGPYSLMKQIRQGRLLIIPARKHCFSNELCLSGKIILRMFRPTK
jgi:hypothetical protein